MALEELKERLRFTIVPESPEHIARHTWFPDSYNVRVTNPNIRRALGNHGLELVQFFAIEKTLKDHAGRIRIAGEKAGAIALSPEYGEQPLVVFQQSKWSHDVSNYVVTPSQHPQFPVDQITTYPDMLRRVVSEAAFDFVHGETAAVDFQANTQIQ